jgi:hypothetical protein
MREKKEPTSLFAETSMEENWLMDIFNTKSKEEMMLTRIKHQIVDKYNLEKSIAAQMALDIVDALSFLDINSSIVDEYILQ